jgi:hypothetical protein
MGAQISVAQIRATLLSVFQKVFQNQMIIWFIWLPSG